VTTKTATRSYIVKGVLPVFSASVLWAFGYLMRKIILHDISPVLLTELISAIAAFFMLVVCRPNLWKLWQSFAAHWQKFVMLALFGVVLGTTLMLVALDHLGLGIATLLEKLQPIFTTILAACFLKEHFPIRLIPYCAAAVVASYFISSPDPLRFDLPATDLSGIAAVLGTAFFWGVSSVIGKSLMTEQLISPEVAILRFLVGALLLIPFLPLVPALQLKVNFSPLIWTLIIGVAVVSTGVGYMLFYKGLKIVSASMSAFLELVTPVVSVLLGLIFLDEKLALTQIAAIPVLLYSIYVIVITPRLPHLPEMPE